MGRASLCYRPIVPLGASVLSGYLVIVPAPGFLVDRTGAPASVPGYNTPPCTDWPTIDQRENRWLCNIRGTPIFGDATYAVSLSVINPVLPEVATSWRVEVWQTGRQRPLAMSRDLKGIDISGTMVGVGAGDEGDVEGRGGRGTRTVLFLQEGEDYSTSRKAGGEN